MGKVFDFRVGDIISYCGEEYKILEINIWNDGGTVVEWCNGHEGSVIHNFKWSAYGEDCKLVKRDNY